MGPWSGVQWTPRGVERLEAEPLLKEWSFWNSYFTVSKQSYFKVLHMDGCEFSGMCFYTHFQTCLEVSNLRFAN